MATNDLRNIIRVETQGIEEFLAFTKKAKSELLAIKKIMQDKGFKGSDSDAMKMAAAYRREMLKAIQDVGKANSKMLLGVMNAQKKALDKPQKTEQDTQRTKELDIAIAVIKELTKQTNESREALKGLQNEIKHLNSEQEKSNKVKKETVQLSQDELVQLEAEKLKKREATQVAKQNAIIQNAEKDTITSLRAQLSLTTLQWSKLTDAETKNTAEGRQLTAEKLRLTKQLKALEEATDDHRRSVGNYSKALGFLEKLSLRLFVGRSIIEGVRNLGGYFRNLVESGKEYNSTLSALSTAFGKVGSGFAFIGTKILEFFAPAILFVTGLIEKIPAVFGGVAAAASQFATNVSANFQTLGLNIQRIFQQINKANPFSKQSTDEINANIARIDAQIKETGDTQKGLIDAYNEGYAATIASQEQFAAQQKQQEEREERLKKLAESKAKAEEERVKGLERQKALSSELISISENRIKAEEQLINELKQLQVEAIQDVTEKALANEQERFRLEQEATADNFLELRKQRLEELEKIKEYLGEKSEQYLLFEIQTYSEINDLRALNNSIATQQEKDHQAALQKIKDDAVQASLEAQEAAAKRSIEIRREEIAETEKLWEEYVENNEAAENEQIEKDVKNAKDRAKSVEDAIVSSVQSTFDNVQKIMKIAADAENKAFEDSLNQRQARIDALNDDLQTATGAQRVFLEKQIAQEKAAQKTLKEQADKARKEQGEAQKAVAITQAIVNTALAVTQALGSAPPPASFILAGAAGAAGAIEIATIAAQQFEKGGVIEGNSHAKGGVRASVKGAPDVELEGGEVVINKRSAKMYRKELSDINVMGGGRKFKFGGEVSPNFQAIAKASNGEQRRVAKEIANTQIVVSVTDITNMQKRVANVAQKSSFS